jgi:uncharacterized protein (DUF1501 family)
MAGTSDSARDSGWMGRWLDGIPESAAGLRGVTIGPSVPLHMRGRTSTVTALETGGDLIGADRSEPWMKPVYDAVTAMGAGTTGRGRLSDLIADTGASAIALSQQLAPLFSPDLPDGSLVPTLTLAARLINADLGVRVIACSFGSFDLHDGHSWGYPQLIAQLDAGIDAFFTTLSSTFRRRVALATFSEFGRTARANGSGGTDHGTASVQLVIGDNVRGGLYGAQPRLDDLDGRGDLKVQVDSAPSMPRSWTAGWAEAAPPCSGASTRTSTCSGPAPVVVPSLHRRGRVVGRRSPTRPPSCASSTSTSSAGPPMPAASPTG